MAGEALFANQAKVGDSIEINKGRYWEEFSVFP